MSNPLACHAGVDVGQERWRELSDLCEEHTDEHTFGYYDAAFMMAFAQGGQDRCVSNMLESIANAIKYNNGPGLRLLNYYDQRSFLVEISLFLSYFVSVADKVQRFSSASYRKSRLQCARRSRVSSAKNTHKCSKNCFLFVISYIGWAGVAHR